MGEGLMTIDAERLRTRDEEALRELFEALYPKLRQLTRHLTARSVPDTIDADDLANETLLCLYNNLDSLLAKSGSDPIDAVDLTLYAYRIARNLLDRYGRPATSAR